MDAALDMSLDQLAAKAPKAKKGSKGAGGGGKVARKSGRGARQQSSKPYQKKARSNGDSSPRIARGPSSDKYL